MKEEIKNIWVNALRSGEYGQGTGALVDNGKYCCLGVLCEIHKKETGEGQWIDNDGHYFSYGPSKEGSRMRKESGVLPPFVMRWSGVKDAAGQIGISDNFLCLTELNDDGKSFEEIADIIEENWKML